MCRSRLLCQIHSARTTAVPPQNPVDARHGDNELKALQIIRDLARAEGVLLAKMQNLADRRIVHVAVTEDPTAAWTAQQLRNAFSENETPRYLLHDRDSVFADVATTIGGMNIQTVRTALRSPWQNAYAERVIGSIRRECLDH